MKTISQHTGKIQDWIPSLDFIEKITLEQGIRNESELRPCGCSIKLDLLDVVYPALAQVSRELPNSKIMHFSERSDAHVQRGKISATKRILVPLSKLSDRSGELAEEIAAFRTDSVIELYTTDSDYFKTREKTKSDFLESVTAKMKILSLAAEKMARKPIAQRANLSYGKGHSIRAGGNAIVFDLLRHDESSLGYSVSNNDTIITADSLLKHDSLLSVFTSLNNSLNDLYLMGVNQNLRLMPIYDGSPQEVKSIQAALLEYQTFHRERGVELTIEDRGPLNLGIQVVGATVIGYADHELPKHHGLLPGQELLATRWLGDLSILGMYKSLNFPQKLYADIEPLRLNVLQKFATSNFIVANVIRKFLPALGEAFDSKRHISFCTDISGPGLFVLEEGAVASGVNVLVENVQFINERSLSYYRKNHSSSTNGPIIIAAMPELLLEIESELSALGLKELWRMGKVLDKCDNPTVFFAESLKKYQNSKNPRLDFFEPIVHFGDEKNPDAMRMPNFSRFEFSPAPHPQSS